MGRHARFYGKGHVITCFNLNNLKFREFATMINGSYIHSWYLTNDEKYVILNEQYAIKRDEFFDGVNKPIW